jgi:predicted lactoylglutathione lyase
MFTLQTITLDAADPTDARAFYEKAFGLTDEISVRQGPGTGRPFTISLVVGQPSTVDSLVDSALAAGATSLKPVEKSFWGYGGIVQAPDGSIWKIATSAKKDSGPATREIDDIVLLLGVADVKASKRFYAERGLGVKRSFGGKYAEFEAAPGAVQLAIYPRRALEKETGVTVDPDAAHGIVLRGGSEAFTDPDGFTWQAGDHGTHDRDEHDR